MTSRGITEAKARDLLTHLKPGQEVLDQIEYVDFLIAKDRRGKLENPPGLYVFYIRDNIAPPSDFWSSRKAKLHEQAQQVKDAEISRRARLEIQYDEYRIGEVNRFATELPPDEYKLLFDQQRSINRAVFKSMTDEQMDDLTHRTIRAELEKSGRIQLLSIEEFCRSLPHSPVEIA